MSEARQQADLLRGSPAPLPARLLVLLHRPPAPYRQLCLPCMLCCACCAGEYDLHEDHLDWEGLQAEYDKLPEREKDRCPCPCRCLHSCTAAASAAGWRASAAARTVGGSCRERSAGAEQPVVH